MSYENKISVFNLNTNLCRVTPPRLGDVPLCYLLYVDYVVTCYVILCYIIYQNIFDIFSPATRRTTAAPKKARCLSLQFGTAIWQTANADVAKQSSSPILLNACTTRNQPGNEHIANVIEHLNHKKPAYKRT